MESGLTFNQLICEFESRHPRVYLRFEISDLRFSGGSALAIGNQILNLKSSILNTSVGRSLTVEHRIVNAYGEGSTPSDPPKASTQEQEQ